MRFAVVTATALRRPDFTCGMAFAVLLKKTLPDLSSVELTGDADNPVKFQGVIELVRPD